jgi:hypothetical protein
MGPKGYVFECTAIFTKRNFLLRPAIEIIEHYARKALPGQPTKIINVHGTGSFAG